ncbi:MAG: CBS domain-containing protein, partial [Gemmatimonadales bacterium]|nr:CBS domain-containing protein [Gemmatimonadales bacterium]
MRISDFMTRDPTCCVPEAMAREAAELMRDNDCGAIPVVENMDNRKLVGMITDRDLAVRGLAEGKGPDATVRELMSVEP